MKTCNKCFMDKEDEEFSRNKTAPDGRLYTCKACCKIYNKAWRIKNGQKPIQKLGGLRGPERKVIYRIWAAMRHRCNNPKNPAYKHYGGRGIKVSKEWNDSFELFVSDMGPKPDLNYSLDRINNDGNYEKSNCRWTTIDVQSRNRRNNHNVTVNGETLCVSEWAKKLGCNCSTIVNRIKIGWDLERAVTHPIRRKSEK